MASKMKIFLWILLVFLGLIAIVLGVLSYLIFADNSSDKITTLSNPVIGLTDEQALAQFDEGFIRYLLYSIEAQKLHNVPFTSNTPKITIQLEDQTFYSEIIKNTVQVKETPIGNEDIIIKTTKIEAIKMIRDKNYIITSFKERLSAIEQKASETDLFLKGYLELSKQFG